MTFIDKAGRWLLASLLIATVSSCGRSSGPGAAVKPASSAEPSPRKAADPAGVLPSLVVFGEVSAFKVTPQGTGPQKDRDAAGALPSTAAQGQSAPYLP